METVKGELRDDSIHVDLSGHIDSENAAEVEQTITELVEGVPDKALWIDGEGLEYISSAGLRVLLRLRKRHTDMHVYNLRPEVYEIFDMTGFTQMIDVQKAYRQVSIEGCEIIGKGANGTIYRIDKDNVVKVYNDPDALDDIQNEREVARLALVLGIPTAISYDVVRVGESYGSVFELLDAKDFSKILATQPERMDWCVEEYVKMLHLIHSTLVPKGDLPDMRETAIGWARFVRDYLPEDAGRKLCSLVEAVPHDDHMIHGDYHTKNLQLTNDEVLLIDMDTLAVGHPVFELASMFNAYLGFSELDPGIILDFQGFDHDTAQLFWNKVLAAYLGTEEEAVIREVEDKARIIGYTRLIRRSIRRGGLEDPARKAEIDHWTEELLELLGRVDSLLFLRHRLEMPAKKDRLPEVLAFLDAHLEAMDCAPKAQMQLDIALEEIFVNIASYAYPGGEGKMTLEIPPAEKPGEVVLRFEDEGVPYDPLAKEDPDVTLSAEERQVGGLGIFMVKQSMDDVSYEHNDGRNILTLTKRWDA